MNRIKPLVLASQSPRRTALLTMAGIVHEVQAPRGDEAVLFAPDELITEAKARAISRTLAKAKASEIAAFNQDCDVVAADTIVVADKQCFGKPLDADDARRILRTLSGKTHHVYTGLCLIRGKKIMTDVVSTAVTFYPWSGEMEELIERYVASGAPLDKAGAYGIQDAGALLIERIDGDYYNVVGLPLSRFWRLRQQFLNELKNE